MEPINNIIQFDAPLNQSSYIKVIGVGGGGGNAVNNMFRKGITGVDFIVSNTDAKHLDASPVKNKIVLGHLGAGNDPAVARQAALDHEEEIREALSHNTQMLFITAGMGGGTGTGAAPVIARIAKDIELDDPVVKQILVVAVVTTPFRFEGRRRQTQAEEGIAELRKYVDSILIINNEKLRKMGNLKLTEGFSVADDVLLAAVKGIAEIITKSSYVSTDFRDVNSVMRNSGTALMGTGVGKGEGRALEAIKAASTSELLNDNDIRGAKNVLLYFSYNPAHEITYDEMGAVTDYITEKIGNYDANIIWGNGEDDTLDDELKITLVATGYECQNNTDNGFPDRGFGKPRNPLPLGPTDTPADSQPKAPEKPVNNDPDGISVISKAPATPREEAPKVVDFAATDATPTKKNVIPLDVKPETQEEPKAKVEERVIDDIFSEMEVRSRRPEQVPVRVERPAMVERPAVVERPAMVERPMVEERATIIDAPVHDNPTSPFGLDLKMASRTERIRMMNTVLHKGNPDEIELLFANEQVNSEAVRTQPRTSAQRETGKLDASGNINELNSFLWGNID